MQQAYVSLFLLKYARLLCSNRPRSMIKGYNKIFQRVDCKIPSSNNYENSDISVAQHSASLREL